MEDHPGADPLTPSLCTPRYDVTRGYRETVKNRVGVNARRQVPGAGKTRVRTLNRRIAVSSRPSLRDTDSGRLPAGSEPNSSG